MDFFADFFTIELTQRKIHHMEFTQRRIFHLKRLMVTLRLSENQ